MEAFAWVRIVKEDDFTCLSWLSRSDTQRHTHNSFFSLTHEYIAFPLLRPRQLIGIVFVTFGSFPLVQNIQKKETKTETNKKTITTSIHQTAKFKHR